MVSGLKARIGLESSRQHAYVLVGLFAFSFVLYGLTFSRGITWLNEGMDGGDFVSAARAFGVPHPTGYPTYIILLRVFGDVVAIGDHAFRANLFSAVVGAAAVPFVYVSALRALALLPEREVGGLVPVKVSALLAALAFATSRLFWSQATVTEVYTLNALFGAVLLMMSLGLVRDLVREGAGSLIGRRTLMAFLLGFGLGNHTTLGLAAVPFGVWVLWLVWKRCGWKGVFDWRPMAGLLAGLAVYVYVPLAAAADPIVSWGSPDSFEGFRWMVSGAIYQPYAFGLSSEYLPGRIATIAQLLFTQFTFVGAVLGIAGLMTIWTYSREFVIASVASAVSITVYAVLYDTVDSFIYLISVFMLFAVWIGVGAAVLAQGVKRYAAKTARLVQHQRRAVVGVFVVAALVVPVWSVVSGYGEIDLSSETGPADFAAETIAKAEGGIVLAEEPELFALVYQSQVAQPELDVMVFGPVMLQFDWYWDQLVQYYGGKMPADRPDHYFGRVEAIVAHNLGLVPVYSTDNDRNHHGNLILVEEGDLFRVEH